MILDKGHSHSGAFTAPGVQAQLLHLYLEKARAVSTNSSCTQELALGTREELILCRQPEWPLSSSWQMREHHLCFCIMCFALLWSFASSVVPFGSGTDKGCADTLTSTSVVLQPCSDKQAKKKKSNLPKVACWLRALLKIELAAPAPSVNLWAVPLNLFLGL